MDIWSKETKRKAFSLIPIRSSFPSRLEGQMAVGFVKLVAMPNLGMPKRLGITLGG
jgi:hypothetical protein